MGLLLMALMVSQATAAEGTTVLRSEVLADGWGDFVEFTQRMAREYRIPFEGQ